MMQRYYFLLENMYRAMIIFWLTCLVGYPRTSAPEPSFYNDKIEKEKNERHDVLEVLQNIPKQPTTKNEYNIYPQPNSQNFYGADMKGVQIRALSPSAIPQNQKLMNHKRENNNEQKNK